MQEQVDWNERYREGTTPWDTQVPAIELVETINALTLPNRAALEIGCGTGTNAVWLASQGFDVSATEISEIALNSARQRAEASKVSVKFEIADITEASPVLAGSVGFVFDRGVFHGMTSTNRPLFAHRVAEALADGGYWLTLCGSADDPLPADLPGPPRLKAIEIIEPTEPLFEIMEIGKCSFVMPDASKRLAWKVLVRKRSRK